MKKQLMLALLSISLLSSSTKTECNWSHKKTVALLVGLLSSAYFYYELNESIEEVPELSKDATTLERMRHFLKYYVLGQQQKEDGLKKLKNGDLQKKVIPARGMGKGYEAVKTVGKVVEAPVTLASCIAYLKLMGMDMSKLFPYA